MGQRLCEIAQAAFIHPAVVALMRERPSDVGKSRFAVTAIRLHARSLEESPRRVSVVRLFASRRKWRLVSAPTAIGILHLDEPICSAKHGFTILTERSRAARESNQYLAGVEHHGHDGC